jgi:hypothetical protein
VGAEQEQRVGDATRRDGPAGCYAGVPAVFQQHTCLNRGGSTREQEDPKVHEGISIANQSGSIVFSHKSTTSSSSYPLLITRARPQHLKKAPRPSHRTSSNPFAETSPPWQANRRHHGSPLGIPLRPSSTHYNPPASFFATHGTSPPSSSFHLQSCSSREFTFHPFSSTSKATPRFALTH